MITGLLPNRGLSPAADDYVRPASAASLSGAPRGRSPRGRRRPRKQQQHNISAAPSAPTNATSLTWAFLLAGLLGTLMNILYVSYQTALKWETETTTADFGVLHQQQLLDNNAPKLPAQIHIPIPNLSHDEPSTPPPVVVDVVDEVITKERFQDPTDPFYDKEPLIQLLQEAGVSPIDNATAASLPTWSEITSLYGAEPVYHGLETCSRFQGSGVASQHFLAVAGTFNTGTNLLAELLIANCHMPARMAQYGPKQRGIRWQTVWGKHTPVFNETFRQTHRVYTDVPDLTADDVFAGVMIRDPFRWMRSMCRHQYAASWLHDESHCPSLVPNDADRAAKPHLKDLDHIPVTIEYAEFTVKHDSLVHFWNEWYLGGCNNKKRIKMCCSIWPRVVQRKSRGSRRSSFSHLFPFLSSLACVCL